MKSYSDNEHGEAKKCLTDLFHVEIVVGLALVKYGYTYSKRENSHALARTHHLSTCRQMRCTLCHTATVSQLLRYNNIELP